MNDGPILIKACLNGARTRDQHPALPITPAELAVEARAAVDAGAAALHIHPRDGDGRQTVEANACAAAVSAVRAAVPGIPVGVTTGAWIEPHPQRLASIQKWTVMPDFASVNFSEEGAIELCALLSSMGIGIEAGLFNLNDARKLVDSGLGPDCLRILVEVGRDPERAVESATAIDVAIEAAAIATPRLHHGAGPATWAVLAAAIDRGHQIRVGLEDTLVLPDGATAAGNADLVRAAVAMVRSAGREPARPPG
jgi:uncharacterized protein (DUF849 family)